MCQCIVLLTFHDSMKRFTGMRSCSSKVSASMWSLCVFVVWEVAFNGDRRRCIYYLAMSLIAYFNLHPRDTLRTHTCVYITRRATPAKLQAISSSTCPCSDSFYPQHLDRSDSASPVASFPRLTEHANKKPRSCSTVYVCRVARVFAVVAHGGRTASHVGVRDAFECHQDFIASERW